MSTANPSSVLIATSLGLCLSTSFSIGSLALTYFAIPAILLPADAPLMPPLELVAERRKRPIRTQKAPKQPLDSGVGDTKETVLDAGATSKILREDEQNDGSPSSSSYLLRQWFHLFSKGMHTLPPVTIGSGVLYIFCAIASPGPVLNASLQTFTTKRIFYLVAALLNVGAMVFTLTALKPVNTALHEMVQEVVNQERRKSISNSNSEDQYVDNKRRETEALIRKWGKMNAVRALLPLMAALSAVVALVS